MTTLLNEKEDSLRKLKETLRKSQQQGEESCKTAVFVVVCVVPSTYIILMRVWEISAAFSPI